MIHLQIYVWRFLRIRTVREGIGVLLEAFRARERRRRNHFGKENISPQCLYTFSLITSSCLLPWFWLRTQKGGFFNNSH